MCQKMCAHAFQHMSMSILTSLFAQVTACLFEISRSTHLHVPPPSAQAPEIAALQVTRSGAKRGSAASCARSSKTSLVEQPDGLKSIPNMTDGSGI